MFHFLESLNNEFSEEEPDNDWENVWNPIFADETKLISLPTLHLIKCNTLAENFMAFFFCIFWILNNVDCNDE
jgi:hypothetical protein